MVKKNTDIGDFPVTKLPTVEKNVSLRDIKTSRGHLIMSTAKKKQKRLRESQVRIGKLLKDFE